MGTTPAPSRQLGGYTNYYLSMGQTHPPTRTVADLFNGGFPIGEIQEHGKTRYPNYLSSWARTTAEERRENERALNEDLYDKVRHASDVHRQVCRYTPRASNHYTLYPNIL
jgi:methionyl aminopeptidase